MVEKKSPHKPFAVTLDNCHEEPIHIPGSIQPHGMLVVIGRHDFIIKQVSENIIRFTGEPADFFLGKKVTELLGESFYTFLNVALNSESKYARTANSIKVKLSPSLVENVLFDAVFHCEGDLVLIDVEQSPQDISIQYASYYHKIKEFTRSLSEHAELQAIFERSVAEVRDLTGYDRVMLYRFDHEYNGEVIAESKVDKLNSFLGQHFPESDIPAQARSLYVKNKVRIIADVNAQPSALVPLLHPDTDGPTDLGFSMLRSVSPIHIQYLKNMGVCASMSISIIVDDHLWGLIACHHYSPHRVSVETREAALFLSVLISHLITTNDRSQARLYDSELLALNARLAENMVQVVNYVDGLRKDIPAMLGLANAEGVVWNLEGHAESYGRTPSDEQTEQLVDWLFTKVGKSFLFHTHKLSDINPEFREFAGVASGILFIVLSFTDRQFFLWVRPEVMNTKHWGGKPEKTIEFLDDGSHRLMPRRSFELWKEKVRFTSAPFNEIEIRNVLKFRNTMQNYLMVNTELLRERNADLERKIAQRTLSLEQEIREREKVQQELELSLRALQASNKELEQFAYIASHDLQEPLRKIQVLGDRLHNFSDQLDTRSQDYLRRMIKAANRMQMLVVDLLSFSRIGVTGESIRYVNLNDIMRDVLSNLHVAIEESGAQIHVGDLGSICADAAQINRLFQNLMQNAIKFVQNGAVPQISITRVEETADTATFEIRDNGIGFEKEYEEKIFGLFSRLHKSNEDYQGTGLGLAVCRKIVDSHRGKIWARSELGEGTAFFIQLPLRGAMDVVAPEEQVLADSFLED